MRCRDTFVMETQISTSMKSGIGASCIPYLDDGWICSDLGWNFIEVGLYPYYSVVTCHIFASPPVVPLFIIPIKCKSMQSSWHDGRHNLVAAVLGTLSCSKAIIIRL